MEPAEDPNWKFGSKTPSPDNMLLSAVHNLLSKNSLASMGGQNHKGISEADFDAAFVG